MHNLIIKPIEIRYICMYPFYQQYYLLINVMFKAENIANITV
jgi:hypothetical protein